MAEKQKKDSVNKVGIKPLGTDLLVKPITVKTKYEKRGGVVTPENTDKSNKRDLYDEHPFRATVVRIGSDYDGEIQVGDVIFHIGGDGYPLIWNDKDYLLLKSDRILGVKDD